MQGCPPAAVHRAAAHGTGGRAAGLPHVSQGRVGGGGIRSQHPGAHRCGARPQQPRPTGAPPRGPPRAQRRQRAHRDARNPPFTATAAEESLSDKAWGLEALKEIGLAILAAVVVGYLGGKLLAFARERGWTSGVSEQIAILALAVLAYGGAVAIGGNGFIAGFAGGILFGAATRGRLAEPVQFSETLGLSASFLVWSIFGALFVGNLLTHDLSARPIVYAILSLTVIRMVPVAIALIGTHLRAATVAFMGWFGPRGLPRSSSHSLPCRRSSTAAAAGCSCRPSPGPSCSQ